MTKLINLGRISRETRGTILNPIHHDASQPTKVGSCFSVAQNKRVDAFFFTSAEPTTQYKDCKLD